MRASLIFVLCPLLIASPVPYDSSHHSECPDMRGVLPSSDNLRSLVLGVVKGLGTEGEEMSKCFNSTIDLAEGVVEVYRNIEQVVSGNVTLIMHVLGSYGKLKNDFEDVIEDCDFSTFWETAEKLFSPMGASVLFLRYTSHQDRILSHLSTLADCLANLSACGHSAGETLRIMLDWTL